MVEDPTPEGLSPCKVYPYSPGRAFLWQARIFVGLCLLLAIGNGYAWYIGHFQKLWLVLVAVGWLSLAAWQSAQLYLLPRVSLVTSPEGLGFFAPGYSISTTWDNIEAIRIQAPLSLAVVYLRQKPALHTSSPLHWLWLRPGRGKLPLYLFQQSWQGELGQDFRQYAPHLFSADINFG